MADARFAKPIDTELLGALAKSHKALITVEEGAVGGFGSQVAAWLSDEGLLDGAMKFRMITMPDAYFDHDKPEAMIARAGLDAQAIADKAAALVKAGKPKA